MRGYVGVRSTGGSVGGVRGGVGRGGGCGDGGGGRWERGGLGWVVKGRQIRGPVLTAICRGGGWGEGGVVCDRVGEEGVCGVASGGCGCGVGVGCDWIGSDVRKG